MSSLGKFDDRSLSLHAHSALPIMQYFCLNALFSPNFCAFIRFVGCSFAFNSIEFLSFRKLNQINYYYSRATGSPGPHKLVLAYNRSFIFFFSES